jgi:Precorrin-2 methylase
MKRPSGVKRLIGVGVGPGDPELVTVKAVRVLREADAVLVPRPGRDRRGAPPDPVAPRPSSGPTSARTGSAVSSSR